MCGDRGITCKSRFSSSTLRFPGVSIRTSSLVASSVIHWATYLISPFGTTLISKHFAEITAYISALYKRKKLFTCMHTCTHWCVYIHTQH